MIETSLRLDGAAQHPVVRLWRDRVVAYWRTALILIVAASIPVACSQTPSGPSSSSTDGMLSIAGLWTGEGYQPALQTNMVWLVDRNADGTFVADFRRYLNCVLVERQVEKGRWRLQGKSYFTSTESIEGIPFDASDEYRIEDLTDTTMKYFHLNSKTMFEARRISAQTGFPVPANCTI